MTALHHGNVLQFHSWYVLAAARMYMSADPVCAHVPAAFCMCSQIAIHELRLLGLGSSDELCMHAGAKQEITSGWCWSTAWGAIS